MRLYLRAISYFKHDRPLIGLLLALIGLSVIVGLLQAWPMAILIDTILSTRPQTDWIHRLFLAPLPQNRLGQVMGITLIGMLLKIAQDSITFARTMINNKLRYNGSARARQDLFDKIQTLGIAYIHKNPQGDTIYRMENDTGGMFGVLDTFIATSVAAITLSAMVWIMVTRSLLLTVFALSVTPVLVWINVWFGRRIHSRALDSKHADACFTTTVQRSLSEMSLIHLFSRQRDQARKMADAVRLSVRQGMRLNWQEAFYPLARDTIFTLGGAVIFGYGGYLVYRDQFLHPIANGVTCGVVIVFMDYLGKLWDPLSRLAGFNAAIQASAAAAYRVFQVLDRPVAVRDPGRPVAMPPRLRDLELDEVSFAYDVGKTVLDGLSARIEAGRMVAFVGASGAGKSTLLHLLPRVFDPLSGAVRLDGIDLRHMSLAEVRKHVALAPQDSPMLATTIAENIAFGCPGSAREEIIFAAQRAGAAEFIESLPRGYDTVLGLDGCNLSGGQRQRLGIARALLADTPILVLDEPTSAQDPRHERTIMQMLKTLHRRRTVILVTHRLENVTGCDHIFVIDHGHIVEQGTHGKLLARQGVYFQMWYAKPPTPTPDPAMSRAA